MTQLTVVEMTYQIDTKDKTVFKNQDVKVTQYPVSSVEHFSYACLRTKPFWLVQAGDTGLQPVFSIDLNEFQLEAFKARHKFSSDVDDCVGFFTIGIWMAIFSGIVMIMIFAFGIAMITNLKTMDRFDDPKGKPLQINARE